MGKHTLWVVRRIGLNSGRMQKLVIILRLFSNSVRQPVRKRLVSVQNLYQCITAILPREVGKYDCCNVQIIDPGIHESYPSVMNYNNRVRALAGDVDNQLIRCRIRKSKSINSFCGELVNKNQAGIAANIYSRICRLEILSEGSPVFRRLSCDCIKGVLMYDGTFAPEPPPQIKVPLVALPGKLGKSTTSINASMSDSLMEL